MPLFARVMTGCFLLLMLVMLAGVVLWPATWGEPFIGAVTYGYFLVLVIHVLPVAAAWYYITTSRPEGDDDE